MGSENSVIFQQYLLRLLRWDCLRSSSFSQIDVNKIFLWFLPDSLEILTFEAFEALSTLKQGDLLRSIFNHYGYKFVRSFWKTFFVKRNILLKNIKEVTKKIAQAKKSCIIVLDSAKKNAIFENWNSNSFVVNTP